MIRKIVDYEVAWRMSDNTPNIYIRPEGYQQMITLPISDDPIEGLFLLLLLQAEKDLFWDDSAHVIQTHNYQQS